MNVLKRLEIEVEGICGTINDYTSESYITNILEQLKKAVEIKDVEKIVFLLNKIDNWYSDNLSKIRANKFVINFETHLKVQESIKFYIEEISKVDYLGLENEQEELNTKQKKKIFISHSSKDEMICSSFVELLETIGISDKEILYTSSARHGIPGDSNIFDYLRGHLSDGITVFYMLSDNYYDSVYCLNEMGASWVIQNDFSIIMLPNFDGQIKGVIDKDKKGYNLRQPIELIQLKNKLTEKFSCNISEEKWEDAKNKFLSIVNSVEVLSSGQSN